ncbi:arsenate reductase [Flavobacteriaceae bacterium]|jgi:arsenate reductase|nr:arsenate reductase [Flavobacteriaceae bacterium]
MKVVFYLKSCNTCTRIIKEIKLDSSFEFREIKSKPLSTEEIEMIYSLSKNYELIFNKRAKLFSEKKLKNVTLTELEYKNLILNNYTFLKRPVIIIGNKIFIGNSKKNVLELKKYLSEQ